MASDRIINEESKDSPGHTEGRGHEPAGSSRVPKPVHTEATIETYNPLQDAYHHFNKALFEKSLPGALITLRNHANAFGYYSFERFGTHKAGRADEIAMNPTYFAWAPIEVTLSVLVHEMVHQYQRYYGKPGRARSHNVEWGRFMIERGLFPSSTGQPGGDRTGDTMSHCIIAGGPFDEACAQLISDGYSLRWFDRYPNSEVIGRKATIQKYTMDELAIKRPRKKRSTEAAEPPHDDDPATQAPGEGRQAPHLDGESPGHEGLEGVDPETPIAAPVPQAPLAPPSESPEIRRLTDQGLITVRHLSAERSANSKTKYSCPVCRANVWGKPGLRIRCEADNESFLPATDLERRAPQSDRSTATDGEENLPN